MRFYQDIVRRNIGSAGIVIFIAGLFFSRALLSISMAFLFAQPFLVYRPAEIWEKLKKNRYIVVFILFYLSILLSWFITKDKPGYLDDIRVKLPLLVVPLGLLYQDMYRKKNVVNIVFALNIMSCLIGLASVGNYLLHFREINDQILHSKPIPIVPHDQLGHIYYSFIIAFTITSGIVFHLRNYLTGKLRIINLTVTIINFVIMHIIAARTGLLALYVTIFVMLIIWGISAKKYLLMSSMIILFSLLGLLSVLYIPSLHNRFENTLLDLKRYQTGKDINFYSISMRIEAWKKTVILIKQHPFTGVGYADVLPEIKNEFKKEGSTLLDENQKEPHNQFLETFAASGIPGILLFGWLFFFPLKRIIREKDILSLSLLIIMFVTFNVESALEMQVGASYYPFITLLVNGMKDS